MSKSVSGHSPLVLFRYRNVTSSVPLEKQNEFELLIRARHASTRASRALLLSDASTFNSPPRRGGGDELEALTRPPPASCHVSLFGGRPHHSEGGLNTVLMARSAAAARQRRRRVTAARLAVIAAAGYTVRRPDRPAGPLQRPSGSLGAPPAPNSREMALRGVRRPQEAFSAVLCGGGSFSLVSSRPAPF